MEVAPDAMLVVDQAGRVVLVNTQTEKLFGYQQEEILGLPVEVLIAERFRERQRGQRVEYSAQPRVRPQGAKLQLFGLRKDGTEFSVEVSLSPIPTPDDMLVTSAIRDITERQLAEESRLRLAAIVESSDDAIVSKSLDGFIVSWNRGAQRIYEYREAEAVGMPITSLLPNELADEEHKVLARVRAGECIEHYETVHVTKEGKRINVSLSLSPIKDSSGTMLGLCSISRDITDRKRGEEALLSSERRYGLLFSRNVAGVAVASLDGRLLDCKHGWARILGYQSKDELRGHHASEFYFNPAERQALVDELFEKKVLFSRDLQLRRKDGTPVWVLFNAAVHSDNDRPIVQCIMIDISEWKSAEEALRTSEERLRPGTIGGSHWVF